MSVESKKNPKSQRQNMVASAIQRAVATAISREEISHPELIAGSVNVMYVNVSPDLKQAIVGISIMGDNEIRTQQFRIMELLQGQIRALIARKLKLRYVPKVVVKMDESIIRQQLIDSLLKP